MCDPWRKDILLLNTCFYCLGDINKDLFFMFRGQVARLIERLAHCAAAFATMSNENSALQIGGPSGEQWVAVFSTEAIVIAVSF